MPNLQEIYQFGKKWLSQQSLGLCSIKVAKQLIEQFETTFFDENMGVKELSTVSPSDVYVQSTLGLSLISSSHQCTLNNHN